MSACILDRAAYDRIASELRPQHFYADANRMVYLAIEDLAGRGQPIDVVTIANLLRDKGKLQAIGGTAYLAQLTDATPAVAHVSAHARIIVQKWNTRQIISVCESITIEGYGDVGDGIAWKQSVDQRVYEVTRSYGTTDHLVMLGDAAAEKTKDIAKRKADKGVALGGISTGIPTLDWRIGGLQRGNKYEIGARPGMGKTGLALNLTLAIARQKLGVVFVSIEMPRDQLALRALSQESNVNSLKLGSGRISDEQFKDVVGACVALGKLPVVIVDAGTQTVSSIRAAVREGIRRLREKYGQDVELGAVVIDYLQMIEPTEDYGGNTDAELTAISRATTQLAKDENCVVIECAQLNRELEKRPDKRPVKSDFRSSGSIEQDAYCIIMIYREDAYRKPGEDKDGSAELLVRKVRGAPEGVVHVKFKAETTTFYETSNNPDYDQLGDIFDDYMEGQYGEQQNQEPPRDWRDDYDR